MSDPSITKTGLSPAEIAGARIGGLEEHTDSSSEVKVATPEVRHAEAATTKIANKAVKQTNTTSIESKTSESKLVNHDYVAEKVVGVLANRKATPAQTLEILSNLAFTSGTPDAKSEETTKNTTALRKQLDKLTPKQRNEIAKRLDSKSMLAVRQAAYEGVGLKSVKDRKFSAALLRGTAEHIDIIRSELGLARPEGEIKNKDAKAARVQINKLLDNADARQSYVKTKLNANQLAKLTEEMTTLNKNLTNVANANPSVCHQFEVDVGRSYVVLEDEKGKKQWLLTPQEKKTNKGAKVGDTRVLVDKAANKLGNFLGGNAAQTMTASQLMNQSSLFACNSGTLTTKVGVEFSLPDGKPVHQINGQESSIYECKKNDDGSLTITGTLKLHASQALVGDKELKNSMFNSNQSEYTSKIVFTVDAKGKFSFDEVSYESRIVEHGGCDPNKEKGVESDFEHLRGHQNSDDVFADVGYDLNVPEQSVLDAINPKPALSAEIADSEVGELNSKLTELIKTDSLSPDVLKGLTAQVDAYKGVRSAAFKSLEQKDMVKTQGLINDLKLLRTELIRQADHQANIAGVNPATAIAIAGIVGSITKTLDEIEPTVAEIRNVEEEMTTGNFDAKATESLMARANLAKLHSQANLATASAFYSKLTTFEAKQAHPDIGSADELNSLVTEFTDRRNAIVAQIDKYASGEGPMPEHGSGVGITDDSAEYKKLSAEILKDLEEGGSLPLTHPRLNEAQLVTIRLTHFYKTNPQYAFLRFDYGPQFRKKLTEQFANGDWSAIKSSFNDLTSNGDVRPLTSTIRPAAAMPHVALEIGRRIIPATNNTQIDGLANQAVTDLKDSSGKLIFNGVRHATLDAYGLNAQTVADSTPEEKSRFVYALKLNDRFKQIAEGKNAITHEQQIEMLSDRKVAGQVAMLLRERAADKAAIELVHTALISNPSLDPRNSKELDTEIILNLDSISMVAPSDSDVGKQNGVTQDIHRRALNRLAKTPVVMHFRGDDGVVRKVTVRVRPRLFNIGITPPGEGRSFLQRIFGRKGYDWEKMDAINSRAIRGLIGNPKDKELGGDVGRVLAYMRARVSTAEDNTIAPEVRLNDQPREDFLDGATPSAFNDRRYDAIETLANQIKDMYNSGAYRQGGNEPYKMASRLALLSNLIGRSTAFNCRNGLDHTNALDAEIKQLGATMSEPFVVRGGSVTRKVDVPKPGEKQDYVRKARFMMNTGQLELEEKNNGLRSFRTRFPFFSKVSGAFSSFASSLRNQFNSPLTRDLYRS